ncbi:centriolar coiled-coil protein of 110 kDa-like isoform X1 [Ceratina calcarata]|uniref:Centriolar coiled-coil protein of 110 kDa-like isoform X1 n=1 Tax=Ceratina calcarata TaxID=156304 RepID=A0AAJ7WCI0_9HYME|nr:centriolar coiled-coil protein of 110 kDa-like isoform X1 [Ceratina calcarata]XP_017884074.1 centriolar coiled-coil protein of 110 kDa-like isoform X1 [Ceratina calcarata]XP_026671348.1 centriolar coiled-coil protein of 110 kDa-like isoform X1 [Ceratina calcarata]XP_026671349.1 centriolar coiled-coil protein of 110 kDa-like isoform X1 [Ceratina calcarata]
MEDRSYVSCIKINGVPILPPMITEDVKREISRYKENAINIEKKLTALRTADSNTNIGKTRNNIKDLKCRKRVDSSKENLVPFNYENASLNDVRIETFKNSNGNLDDSSTKQKFEDRINLASRSESIDSSVNTDHSNDTSSAKSTEIWKPQVPRTLDIVPLTLNDSNCKGSKEYQEDFEDTPKLTRQGSYVLETPSPILLAHMQMQVAGSSSPPPCSEYIPTSQAKTTNRRKEWNVAQAKIDWEYEGKNKMSDSIESLKSPTTNHGSSHMHIGRVMSKSLSLQTKSEPLVMYSTKSADCIRTMLVQETANKSCTHISRNKKHTDNNDDKKQKRHIWNKCNSSSPVNSVCKLGGSLDDLGENNKGVREKPSGNVELRDSVSKLKSSIASDKLLVVYRKVQEMHKKQMAELMYRQQREQTLLQKEFEKQQLLLLNEIRKSFPEVSVSFTSENVPSPNLDRVTDAEKLSDNSDNSVEKSNNNLEQNNEANYSQDNTKTIPCPLDYIYPEINCNSAPCSIKYSHNARSEMELPLNVNYSPPRTGKEDAEQSSTKTSEVKLSEESGQCKRSNVSRELFPLETIRVPILDRTIYSMKHIKAANTINAYARGYLVRRLMRTERVIGLKNTYKEALHCMLKLHVDAPLNRSEFNLLHRLQLQCDAASMNLAELFAQSPQKRMRIIAQDREIKQSRAERPTSARSYSFATQRTLARKKLKEMEECHPTSFVRPCLSSRSRCQTWTSDIKERLISSHVLNHSIKRSTSAGTVRKPWR